MNLTFKRKKKKNKFKKKTKNEKKEHHNVRKSRKGETILFVSYMLLNHFDLKQNVTFI